MTRVLLSLVVAASLMVSAVSAAASTPLPMQLSNSATIAAAAHLAVTVGEMSIHTAAVTRAGAVTFTVQNTGTVTHELVVPRTDLAEDQLPANADEPGKVREDGSLGESGDLAAGKTADFTLTLTPGHYVLICNEPGHYAGGMHTTLIVVSYVGVTLHEMSISADTLSVPAGPVTFGVSNAGTITHELVVLRTDTAFDQLPANLDEPGKVSEEGSGGESGDIAAGRWSAFLLTLSPGHYVLICNEPGHYAGGMRIAFMVR